MPTLNNTLQDEVLDIDEQYTHLASYEQYADDALTRPTSYPDATLAYFTSYIEQPTQFTSYIDQLTQFTSYIDQLTQPHLMSYVEQVPTHLTHLTSYIAPDELYAADETHLTSYVCWWLSAC